jgi:hypothetical protein
VQGSRVKREENESGVAQAANLGANEGDYQRLLRGLKTFCIWIARERELRPEQEGGRQAPQQEGCGLAF